MQDIDSDFEKARRWAAERLAKVGIFASEAEQKGIEVTDFGTGERARVGLQVLVYINTPRVCSKEMVIQPWQICPEHMHPTQPTNPGKEETFRCRDGEAYVYLPGDPTPNPRARVPDDLRRHLNIWHEVILRPGDQLTIQPNTLHWFQAGPDGAVVSEFATHSADELDIFTDPAIMAWRRARPA
jgi:D-lyxose ketol-isomerase